MQFEADVSNSPNPTGYRYLLRLKASDGSSEYAIPDGFGAWKWIMAEHLTGVDWPIFEKSIPLPGSRRHVGTIDLNEHSLADLTQFRIPKISDRIDTVLTWYHQQWTDKSAE